MSRRGERDGLEFLDLQDPQVRPPAMEPEQRIVIGTRASREPLAAAGMIEHPTDSDAVDIRCLNTDSYDPTREEVHDEHHPEALQRDGLTSKQIDTPQTIASLCHHREPRGPLPSGLRTVVLCENPPYDVLVDLDTECMGHLLSDARTAESWIAALHLQDHGDQLFGRSFGSGATPRPTREQQSIFAQDQRAMKSQQRRGPDGDRDFQKATRAHQ